MIPMLMFMAKMCLRQKVMSSALIEIKKVIRAWKLLNSFARRNYVVIKPQN